MDALPSVLILEILNRVNDFTDLVRCRLSSKTLNSLSYNVRSLNLFCSYDRYLKSKAPGTKASVTPFKKVIKQVLQNLRNIEYVAIGVEKPFRGLFDDDDGDDESDDLYLSDVNFVSEWLPEISGSLRSLSVSDFWAQSCWRQSEVLSRISSCCHVLLELELKNAWLSVKGLKPMPMLTSLTLEYVRLDDEDLDKVNQCFPSLETLSLIGVGGLKEPKIHLWQLRTCHWTLSNAPISLTIHAPNLTSLKLNCVKPRSLVLEAPLLSALYLCIEGTDKFGLACLYHLKSLCIKTADICILGQLFQYGRTVKTLVVDSPKWDELVGVGGEVGFGALSSAFPNVCDLELGPRAWSSLEMSFCMRSLNDGSRMKDLKRLMIYLGLSEFRVTCSFISSLLDHCTNLSDVALLIHRDVSFDVASRLKSRCMTDFPGFRWRWGIWKEETKDIWIS
ncbi:F-box/LRR-repeat protein At4g29420 [Macadamia integrifolia]|uniref:F-box/LRR-repeat protein At4g29420 n=1 Tax=Macadamia integrifolia TaxID=60698 RepID=UPI001C4F3C4C|nr:F-box/LRR-repeat protein At4g29420 [Macadamia integrifolia]